MRGKRTRPSFAPLGMAGGRGLPAGGHAVAAEAQLGSIPSNAYYATLPAYWNGNYTGALAAFQSEFNAAIKSPGSASASGRWIDSICYLTMMGECYYHMGRLPEALNQYNNALTLYATFNDWMLRVQFPATISAGRSRVAGEGAVGSVAAANRGRSISARHS